MRYLIIGNSAAGVFAAETIRSLDKSGRIEIISDEKYPAYARCLTSYYLTGSIPEDKLFIRDDGFYTRNNIILHSSQKAVSIDPLKHEVHTNRGNVYQYDKLLIASGASPVMPDIPGVGMKGVFGLRTLDDAKCCSNRSWFGISESGLCPYEIRTVSYLYSVFQSDHVADA